MRIFLVRHGRPSLPDQDAIGHRAFARYIDAYQDAGLDPQSAPPEELRDLVAGVTEVFTSDLQRAHESARRLVPDAELVADPLFTEAPLAAPPIPLLRLKVPAWAIVARVLWHTGYHPEIEDYRRAKQRAVRAADILEAKARSQGAAVLVAHGYFNAMIGRQLRKRGWAPTGAHRARYWNVVSYDLAAAHAQAAPRAARSRRRTDSAQAAE